MSKTRRHSSTVLPICNKHVTGLFCLPFFQLRRPLGLNFKRRVQLTFPTWNHHHFTNIHKMNGASEFGAGRVVADVGSTYYSGGQPRTGESQQIVHPAPSSGNLISPYASGQRPPQSGDQPAGTSAASPMPSDSLHVAQGATSPLPVGSIAGSASMVPRTSSASKAASLLMKATFFGSPAVNESVLSKQQSLKPSASFEMGSGDLSGHSIKDAALVEQSKSGFWAKTKNTAEVRLEY